MLRQQALQMVNDKIASCNKCSELSSYRLGNRYHYVPGSGNPSARIMFIGEAPGENEAKTGEPFCGKAGNLLTNIIKAANWSREEVFITNTIKCRPPGNRDPEACEAANCRKFLELQIKIIDPEWIVCLGRIASVHLLGGDPDDTMGDFRGKIHDFQGKKVICTYHPSYVLRQSDNKARAQQARQDIWLDLQPILALRTIDGVV